MTLNENDDAIERVVKKLTRVKLVLSDVDGMMTSGIHLDSDGREIKVFCEKDAPRIVEVVRIGIPFVMISGRNSTAAAVRAKELGATFHWRKELVHPRDAFSWIEERYHVSRHATFYLGDDWGDLWWMAQAGVSATPQDAATECLRRATIVTKRRGGEGAVGEALDHLLQVKGVYNDIVDRLIHQSP